MARCFVALPLPEAYQQGLEKLTLTLRRGLASDITWTRPGSWHLTLKFLGEVPEADLDAVRQVLSSVPFEPFTFQAGRGGFFPNSYKPRITWVGLKQGAESTTALAGQVEAALIPLGFAPEERPFHPHLTIGRIKKPAKDDWNKLLKPLWKRSWPEIMMDRFVLYSSELAHHGPTYTPLGHFPMP